MPFLKKLNNGGSNDRGRSRGSTRDVFSMPNEQSEKNKVSFKDIANTLLRTTLLVKNLSVSYRQNQGVVLPGFNKKPHFFGQDWEAMAPGIPFVLGSQNIDIRELSSQGGWLTSNTNLNQFFRMTNSETLNLRGTLEPIKGFRIELTANRVKTNNIEEIYRFDSRVGLLQFF